MHYAASSYIHKLDKQHLGPVGSGGKNQLMTDSNSASALLEIYFEL
jgi:hypothetical protein